MGRASSSGLAWNCVATLTEPMAMTGSPVRCLVQPARVRSEPSKPGRQYRRVETWNSETPASASGVRKAASSSGVCAIRASYCPTFHCEKRNATGKSGPTAARTAAATSALNRTRPAAPPPYLSVRRLVAGQWNWSRR